MVVEGAFEETPAFALEDAQIQKVPAEVPFNTKHVLASAESILLSTGPHSVKNPISPRKSITILVVYLFGGYQMSSTPKLFPSNNSISSTQPNRV